MVWPERDPKDRNYLIAVNKKTGQTVWEHDESYGSWSTPVIASVKGQDQVVIGHSQDVKNAPESKNGYLKGSIPRPDRSCGSARASTVTSTRRRSLPMEWP